MEEEEEEYVVEKIVSHRMTRKGKLEYFLKWKGFTDADNTWEPAENLNCRELVDAYEAERKKKKTTKAKEEKKGAKRKSTASGESGSSAGRKKVEKNGFEKGLTAEEIIGATEENGEVHFLLKWKEANEDYELVPARTVNVKIPQMVISFYEARLTWSNVNSLDILDEDEAGKNNTEEEGNETAEEEAPPLNASAEVAVS